MNNKNITVKCWDRSDFFNHEVYNPHLYFFVNKDGDIMWEESDEILPPGFLRIPSTALVEFGGTHAEALTTLTEAGFVNIIDVKDVV